MSRANTSLPSSYFENLYKNDDDPWRFETSSYEREKYQATLDALPQMTYEAALEVGCSIGVLTEKLASRSANVLALDVAEAALVRALARCAGLPHVHFMKAHVPQEWPGGRYDLIVLSEMLYYLDYGDLSSLADRVGAALQSRGDIVLVHWVRETDYPLTGDAAAEHFIARAGFARLCHQKRTADYRLDVLKADREP